MAASSPSLETQSLRRGAETPMASPVTTDTKAFRVAALYRFTRFDDPAACKARWPRPAAPWASGARCYWPARGSTAPSPEPTPPSRASGPYPRPARLRRPRAQDRLGGRDALPPHEGAAEEGDRHPGPAGPGPRRQRRDLCRAGRLERPDRRSRRRGDRHPQRLRGRHRRLRTRGRSRTSSFSAFPDWFRDYRAGLEQRARPRRPAAEGGHVLHRRHPLREVDGLPEVGGDRGRLPPEGRHPRLSGAGAANPKACGAANASCSTSAWRSAMA
jgi:hypothetical protein